MNPDKTYGVIDHDAKMNILNKNIKGIFGKNGDAWLDNLSNIVEVLSQHWKLENVIPVDNMTYNFVAKATSLTHGQVILKISCDQKSSYEEKAALNYFHGNGAIRMIDYHEKHHALLLYQAIPGVSLKSDYPSEVDNVIERYVTTMKKLHSKPLPQHHSFRHIRDWLQAIDKMPTDRFSETILNKTIELKNQLLDSSKESVLLHGDLHHDNFIQDGNEWIAIDPKGIVGEPEFELAAFDVLHPTELENNQNLKNIFEQRVKKLSNKAHVDFERLKQWIFVRVILSIAWHFEDNTDPSFDFKLLNSLFI